MLIYEGFGTKSPKDVIIKGFIAFTGTAPILKNTGTFENPVYVSLKTDGDPIGIIKMFAGNITSLRSYFRCDGRLLSKTTYADLYNVIGDRYGVSDDGLQFRIPNFEDNNKFPRGAASDSELGDTGGEATVTLSEDEMPDHIHEIFNATHNHSYRVPTTGNRVRRITGGTDPSPSYIQSDAYIKRGTNTVTLDLETIGESNEHENRPPFNSIYFIIKYKLDDTSDTRFQ